MALIAKLSKWLVILMIFTSVIGYVPVHAESAEETESSAGTESSEQSFVEQQYHQLLEEWQKEFRDSTSFESAISPIDFQGVDEENIVSASESNGYGEEVVHFHSGNSITFDVEVPEDGLYNIGFDYRILGDSLLNPEFSIMVNGEFQFLESRRIIAPINWEYTSETFETNRYGDELIPNQTQVEQWKNLRARDAISLQPEPLRFLLREGVNTITLTNTASEMFLGRVYIQSPETVKSYEEFLEKHADAQLQSGLYIQEAEQPYMKNSSSIRPIAVQSPHIIPYDSSRLLLNTLGGESWSSSGESVTWKVNVEESGLYALSLKVLQDLTGTSVYRTIMINGEIPFEEAKHYPFTDSRSWRNETISDEKGNPYLFYLNEGENTITLVADSSPLHSAVNSLASIRTEIGELALSIRKLTGGQSDANREWEIMEFIPDIEDQLASWIERLEENKEFIQNLYASDVQSSHEVNLSLSIDKLARLKEEPNEIPNRLNELSEGASSAAQMISNLEGSFQEQPLLVDRIFVHGDEELPEPTVDLATQAISGVQRFISSFTRGTTDIGATEEGTLEVWVARSQQHVELLQMMADSTFTPETGIDVKFSVMPNESKLILANAGGQQPDVALGVSVVTPYDLAIRGAAVDLTQFPDFKDYIQHFSPGAFLPLMLDDGVFGLPETQDFYVTFYRKDIMNKLNIPIPDTWDEVIGILPELQRNGLNYFVPLSGSSAHKPFMFTAPFFYQFGGDFFSDDAMSTAINSEESLEAMRLMTELYTLYSLPLQVGNFYNSFRYGTLPIGISNFETYIQLTVAAPEIAGSWNLAPHPGVEQEDGTIARWAAGSAQASMIFEESDKQEEAWELLKWWMSTETQTDYATNLRILFGDEFMWSTANVEAFANLPMPEEHKQVILEQWEHLKEVPRTPASYIVEREVSNAWNRVVFDGANVRSAVDSSTITINREIRRRMEEFGYMENGEVVKPYVLPRLETVQEWMENEGE